MTKTPLKLSSSVTFLYKYLLPALYLPGCPWWFTVALREGGWLWLVALGWSIGCVLLVYWVWHMERVSAEGEYFHVSNGYSIHHVPITHLHRITEHRWNRAPTISLYFDPPTPFGARVRIVPPLQFLGVRRYNEVASFLNSLIRSSELHAIA